MTDERLGTSARSTAVVTDWLTVNAGSARVLQAVLATRPEAEIHAILYDPRGFVGTPIANRRVHTSFIQRLPAARRWYRAYLPLMPLAVEQLDVRAHDVVISLSYAVAKGVLTRADQLHVSYVFTPVRYAWDLQEDYLADGRWDRGLRGMCARPILHYLRMWDFASARRPDVLVAASRYVASRIRKTYGRRAPVIYPPVDVSRFAPQRQREDYYVTVSRLVPYKKIAMLAEAFTRLGRQLVIIGDGPERHAIERAAGPTVKVLGWQPDSVVTSHLERCRAFVFGAVEDFGISPVEALAAGAPVIAYGRGGVTESVQHGVTGWLYNAQTVDGVVAAVRAFESRRHEFPIERLRHSAERFNRPRFQRELDALVDRRWEMLRRALASGPSRSPRSAIASS